MYINEELNFTSSELKILKKMLVNPEEDVPKLFSIIQKKINNSTKELKKSEESLKTVIGHIPIMIAHLDHQFNFLNVNMAYAKADEKNQLFYVGKNHFDLYPNIENEQIFKNVVGTGEPYFIDAKPFEFVDSPERGVSYWDWSLIPIKNQNKEVVELVLTVQDVTRRKRAEQKLRESEEILRATLDSTEDGILVLGEKGQITHINSKFGDMWRIPQDLIVERDNQKLLDYVLNQLKDPKAFLSKLNRLQRSKSEDFDTIYFKDGRIFERFSSPLVIDDKIKARVLSFRNIAERKKSEQTLKESEEKYRQLVENIPDAIYSALADETGTTIFMSKRWHDWTGFAPEDFYNDPKTWEKSMHPDDRESTLKKFIEMWKLEKEYILEYRVIHRETEEVFFLRDHGVPVYDDKVNLLRYDGTVTDISNQKEAEEKLKESDYNLRERVKELNCLYELSKLVEFPDISIEEVIEKAIDLIPPAWQFPEITCARIIYKDSEFKTGNFVKTKWSQKANIKVGEETIGSVEVYYLKKMPKFNEGPFLKEERDLINGFTEILGGFFQRKKVKLSINRLNLELEQKVIERTEKLKESERRYRDLFENSPIAIELYDSNGKLSIANKACLDMFGVVDIAEVIGFELFNDPNIPREELKKIKNGKSVKYEAHFDFEKVKEFNLYKTSKSGQVHLYHEITPLFLNGTELINKYLVHIQDISKRKESEKKLKLSNEIIKNLVEGIYLIRVDDGTIAYANPKFEEMFGYSTGEMVGKHVSIVNAPTDKKPEEVAINIMKILEETGEWHGEVKNIKKDGTEFWCYANVSTFEHSEYGEVLVSIHTDITEKKLIEEKLKESEEKYRLIFDNSPIGIGISNKAGEIVTINKKMEELTQFTLEEINELGLEATYVDPNERIKLLRILKETGIVKDYELKLKRANGTPYLGLLNINMIELGGEMLIHTAMMDITERRNAEIKLKESEEKFRKTISDLDVGYYEVELDGRLIFHNPALNIILGYDPSEDLKGIKMIEFWENPADREKYLDDLNKFGYIKNYIIKGKKKNGEKIFLELNAHLVRGESGLPSSIEGTFVDVTIKFELEQNLKEQNIKLREINDFKTNILNRTSHELQTPLISIKGFTDILLNKFEDKLDKNMTEYLEIININANRLVKTIRSIIDTAYFEKDRLKINVYLEDLAYLIRDCIKNNKRLINLRNHSIDIDIQDVLITNFDKDYIYRVFESVFENAINNTPTGGKIQVHSKTQNNFIIISIEDNGVGLTKEEKTQIFKPFGKIERYGKSVDVIIDGPGLSLYLCEKIMELHDGKIWVESAGRNKGSIFYFSLPLVSN